MPKRDVKPYSTTTTTTTTTTLRIYTSKLIDINETASKLGDKCYGLLVVNALSGCDTASYPFGKGKVTAVNLLLKGEFNFEIFSDPMSQEIKWIQAGMSFISYLYCGKSVESLSKLRFNIFNNKKNPPKIKCVPPTDESAVAHVKYMLVFKC